MTETIRAPWTSEQVDALNGFQQTGGMHPFTCGTEHHVQSPVLDATHSGWICPDPSCDYTQDWAHAFMADPAEWPVPQTERLIGGRRLGPVVGHATIGVHVEATAVPDWYDAGCARDCTEQHTYTWGRCALAPESARPEPTISIGRVEPGPDGQPEIVLRTIPLDAWNALINVAQWVSRGRSAAFIPDEHLGPRYPDAKARRALGALHEAGLLDSQESQ
ncbi:hypothetical protein [Streptomyces sp. BH104]|uniref:hypothetical protein n=1 Tax=Streptomyces sp. BH104 TaxID=3410407 RepID=UPI003BB49330